jgi:serine/threonine protein kinase
MSDAPALPIITVHGLVIRKKLGQGCSGFVREATLQGRRVVAKVTTIPVFTSHFRAPASSKSVVWRQSTFLIEKPERFGILKESADYRELTNGLKQEAEMLNVLRHDNIVHLFGVFISPETELPMYLIMERSDFTLRSWLGRVGRISLDKLVKISRDISRGLVYLHTRSPPIVHRDLKDDNVLIFVVGDDIIPKLCDMDMARVGTMSGRVSAKGGALYYRAPEFKEGAIYVDSKVDVFSFGVMLAEIVLKYLPDSRGVATPVTEPISVENRFMMINAALSKLDDVPVMTALIEGCVQVDPVTRWSSSRVTSTLEFLHTALKSVEDNATKDERLAEQDRLLRDKDAAIAEKERQVSQVSVCWNWRLISRCTFSVSFRITNNANG